MTYLASCKTLTPLLLIIYLSVYLTLQFCVYLSKQQHQQSKTEYDHRPQISVNAMW